MAKNTEVATVDENIPAYLRDMQGKSVPLDDNFDSGDLTLPRITLLQGTSEACKEFLSLIHI